MMNMQQWVGKWWQHLPPDAQREFTEIIDPFGFVSHEDAGRTESSIQTSGIVLASMEFGTPLWGNNSGAAMMVNPKRLDEPPRHVRFGLGNSSAKVNRAWKSADSIGIRPTFITPQMMGMTLGVFTAIEFKKDGWKLNRGDKHGQAQNNFLTAVQSFGGIAGFAQSDNDVRRILEGKRP